MRDIKQYAPGEHVMKDLGRRFTFHPVQGDQGERYQLIRERAHHYAHTLVTHCPPSDELTQALFYLETAVMFANAAIARNE